MLFDALSGTTRVAAAVACLCLGAAVGLVLVRDPAPDVRAEVLGVEIRRTPAPSPRPDASPTPDVTATPAPSPIAAPTPAPASSVEAAPTPTPTPSGPRNPLPRPAEIDCDADPRFCSSSAWSMEVTGGLESITASSVGPLTREEVENPRFPTFVLGSVPVNAVGTPARAGDPVAAVRITMTITNDSQTTFFFPDGELSLQMTRDGQPVSTPTFRAGPVEMRPGTDPAGVQDTLAATFLVPITADGTYEWRGTTFFHD